MVNQEAAMRVVEISRGIAASYAGWLLASLGADVISLGEKVQTHDPESLARQALGDGKKLIDLPQNQQDFAALLDGCDVVLCDAPALLAMLAGPLDSLEQRFPGIIFAIATPLGLEGPYANYPATSLDAQALSAVSWALGEPDQAPLSLPPGILEHQAGAFLASGILVALRHRADTGEGNRVDIALSDILASYVAGNCRFFIHHGMEWRRSGPRATSSGGAYPFVVLPCADGAVCISGRTRDEWNRLVKVMGDPVWASEPRYQDLRAMGRQYPDEVDALVKPWFARHSMAELERLALDNNLIVAPVRSLADVLTTPHFKASEFLAEGVIDGKPIQLPGIPFKATTHRTAESANIVPQLLATSIAGVVPTTKRAGGLPLAGLRVIDFGWVWSAPWVGTMLGELGAQVIKIEHGKKLDNLRLSGKVWRDGAVVEGPSTEMSPMYHQINHGKLGITLNAKAPRAVELLKQLVAGSDLVIENMSPGSMERSGLGYEDLRKINPKLVMLAMSAAGQFGELSGMRAYAPTMSSFAGLEAMVGYPDGQPIGALNFAIGDPNASAHGLFAVLAGLHRARATGEGCYIDLSQIAALTNTLRPYLIKAQLDGCEPKLTGNRSPTMAPHGVYPSAGADQWLTIAVADDAQWQVLAALAQGESFARDPAFTSMAGRLKAVAALDQAIADWTRGQGRDELVGKLRDAGIASSPVLTIDEMWKDPHLAARSIKSPVDIPVYGPEDVFRAPWLFSRFAPQINQPGPRLGQHNQQVLGDILGLPSDEIEELVAAGVVA